MKILIVEDDENSRELQHAMLEGTGYEVVSAKNGREAMELVLTTPFDLVISDILMPEMDGFELCRHMKQNPHLAKIPFVFYTATYTAPDDQELADDVGADLYLQKPMDPTEYIAAVTAMLPVHGKAGAPMEDFDARHSEALLRKLCEKAGELQFTGKLLQTTEERYRRIVEALNRNYFFYLYDDTGELKYVSPSSVGILGCATDKELHTLMARIAGGPFDGAATERGHFPALRSEIVGYEAAVMRGDGRECLLDITETPILDENGHVIEVQGVAHDITERARLEAERRRLEQSLYQAQKMEIIGTMASGIAHDFNNMLLAITGYAELLQMEIESGPAERAEYVNEILVAGRRAAKLIRQMLTLSRRDSTSRRPVDIVQVAGEAMGLIRAGVPKCIQLDFQSQPNCPDVVADDTEMIQLIMNLCVNGAHAIGDGKGTITVKVEPFYGPPDPGAMTVARPASHVCIHVRDTGCGMSPEMLNHIFEPYFSTKERGQGTGLGLAIVQSIVQKHKGYVKVSSEPGKGSIFSVFLPVADPEASAGSSKSQPARRILLVEEPTSSSEFVRSMLALQNYWVTTANSAAEAMRRCEDSTEPYLAALVDDTRQNVEMIGQMRKRFPEMPIILMQRQAGEGQRLEGIAAVLRKPFTHHDLNACMEGLGA